MDRLARDTPREAAESLSYVPQLEVSETTTSVISLHITYFRNRGFPVAITLNHAVLKGKTTAMFLRAWASICKHGENHRLPKELTPSFDRTKGTKRVVNHGREFTLIVEVSSAVEIDIFVDHSAVGAGERLYRLYSGSTRHARSRPGCKVSVELRSFDYDGTLSVKVERVRRRQGGALQVARRRNRQEGEGRGGEGREFWAGEGGTRGTERVINYGRKVTLIIDVISARFTFANHCDVGANKRLYQLHLWVDPASPFTIQTVLTWTGPTWKQGCKIPVELGSLHYDGTLSVEVEWVGRRLGGDRPRTSSEGRRCGYQRDIGNERVVNHWREFTLIVDVSLVVEIDTFADHSDDERLYRLYLWVDPACPYSTRMVCTWTGPTWKQGCKVPVELGWLDYDGMLSVEVERVGRRPGGDRPGTLHGDAIIGRAKSNPCQWGVTADLIEIDVGHGFISTWSDINRAFLLLRRGGVMFGHDYFRNAVGFGVRRAVNLFAKIYGLKVQIDGEHWVIRTS
ncbi:unnamed protein product [Linum tenue]|uniref:Uncharacterized protein n=1 Tax=Linum tenue TaxID=586396 RepID=A0AAV0N6Q6_9ROSI|nr:unnamed protein product [Linum tenue]